MSMVTNAAFPPLSSFSACSSWLPAAKSHLPPLTSEVVVSPLQPRFSSFSSPPFAPSRAAVRAGYAVSRSSAPPGW